MLAKRKLRKRILLTFLVLLMAFVFTIPGYDTTLAGSSMSKRKVTGPFRVAAIQFNPQLNERDKNVEELLKVAEEAFCNGAKLAVAPEMATTGYYYKDREAIAPFVDTIPGKVTDKFAALTRKYHSYIVFGMPEVDERTGLYYNSAVLIGPNGYIGKYRKTHQWETEEHWAAWGDLGVPVFDTELGKIAINICMDSAYFESARLAALGGADILAFPTNSSAQAISALPARAQQNGIYIISANRSNTESGFHMIGASAIWSPEGKKLAEAPLVPDQKSDVNEPTIIYATIDPKKYDNDNKRALAGRRPELYKELMLYIAPWDYTKNTKPHDVVAAAIQYAPVGDRAANREKVVRLLRDAKKQAAEKGKSLNLVVLPELSVAGPVDNLNIDGIKALSEKADGATFAFMSGLAKEYETAIVYGFIEKDGWRLYNSAALVNKHGALVGVYRKTHLSLSDKRWATPGDKLPVFEDEELGKVGILIGDDARYPEAAGVLAVKRADIIAIPSAWYGQYGGEMEINREISANRYPDGAMVTWDSVAMGAQAYTVVANYVGTRKNYLGRSALYTLDPLYGLDQPVVAPANHEYALVVNFQTIQPDWWFNQEKLIASRRTTYYLPLIQ